MYMISNFDDVVFLTAVGQKLPDYAVARCDFKIKSDGMRNSW